MRDALIFFIAEWLYFLVIVITFVYFLLVPRNIQKNLAILAIIALPSIYLVSRIVSLFYFDPRPFVVGHFIPLVPHTPDNGFVSDHTLLTSAVAMVVLFYNKKVSLALWGLTIIIGVARVLAGVHHIVDIVGAAIISIVITTAIDILLRRSKIIYYRA